MPDVSLRSIEPLIVIGLSRVCGSDPPAHPAIAALLGRFLPRLGPLVATQAAFLFIYAVTSAEQYEGPSTALLVLVPARRHHAHIAHLEFRTDPQRNLENSRGKYLECVPLRGPPILFPLSEDPKTKGDPPRASQGHVTSSPENSGHAVSAIARCRI